MQVLHKAILQYLHLGYITKLSSIIYVGFKWRMDSKMQYLFIGEETLIVNSKMFKWL
jgi:hypothetical protein